MPTKRPRGETWEFVVRRKGELPKPLYFTFGDAAEGDAYCRRLEALLDCGVVLDKFNQQAGGSVTLAGVITDYRDKVAVPHSDVELLELPARRIGAARISALGHRGARSWSRT